jgi:hypothetical protein
MELRSLDPRKNVWARVVLVGVAMLLVPALAWILLPTAARSPVAEPPASAAPRSVPRPVSSDRPVLTRTLSGKIVDDGGAPMRGVAVKFDAATGEPGPHTTSDDDGAFLLDRVPDAAGSVVASRVGYLTARHAVGAGGDESGLVLTLGRAQAVKGQVVDGDGKGVAGAVVRCDPDGAIAATTVEEGRFELAVGSDGCDAQAIHGDYGTSETVHVSPGGKNILVLPSPGGIAGIVIDERGQPVTSFIVAVESFVPADKTSEGMGGAQKTVNDPSGAFELTGLGKGRYILTASAEGRPPTRSDPIEVEAGRTTRGVRIRLDRGISLSGVVLDRATKQPLAGVKVALDSVTTTGANAIAPAITGEDGSFTIEGVPAASFSVRFGKSGYRDKITTLDGRGKTELKSQIELAAAGEGSFEMVGVGAALWQQKDYVSFSSIIPDGPADKAGIQVGDLILRIDGQSAQGFIVNDCVQRLRGVEGTSITLTLGRGDKVFDVTVKRALIVR